MYQGIAGSPGIAIGKAYIYTKEEIAINRSAIAADQAGSEVARLNSAIDSTSEQLNAIRKKALAESGEEQAKIFDAHIAILHDPALCTDITQMITDESISVTYAVEKVVGQYSSLFEAMDDEYMRERAADIRDIGDRLLRNLTGVAVDELADLDSQVIIVTEDLTPSDTANLDKNLIKGFVTKLGGRTSHAAIIARTLEIPAVMGLGETLAGISDGDMLVVDGNSGEVYVNPESQLIATYEERLRRYNVLQAELKELCSVPAVTTDGKSVEIAVNIGSPKDIDSALTWGAEGVGLYRTEFLYIDKDRLPNEEEQFKAYKVVAEKLGGKPLIIRTLDIGGDKELKCVQLPKEMNPFLGYRAIRICLDRVDIFRTQLRAILRASAYGNVLIMYPMISGIEELRAANDILRDVKEELNKEGVSFDQDIKVGIMVEIPSAAIMAEALIKEADFFSIGTNDLCQYTLAVDRGNERISNLYQPLHPAVLRLIKNVIEVSHRHGKFTGMCGELAGDPLATIILLGMGLNEFSMSAASIPLVKKIIRSISYQEAQAAADLVLSMTTIEEIVEYCKTLKLRLENSKGWED